MKKSLLAVFVLSLATLLVAGCMNNNPDEVALEDVVAEEEVILDVVVEEEDAVVVEVAEDALVEEVEAE